MTAFEDLPEDFDKMLTDINKAYPSRANVAKGGSIAGQLSKARP
jgi:hypothetical protein